MWRKTGCLCLTEDALELLVSCKVCLDFIGALTGGGLTAKGETPASGIMEAGCLRTMETLQEEMSLTQCLLRMKFSNLHVKAVICWLNHPFLGGCPSSVLAYRVGEISGTKMCNILTSFISIKLSVATESTNADTDTGWGNWRPLITFHTVFFFVCSTKFSQHH